MSALKSSTVTERRRHMAWTVGAIGGVGPTHWLTIVARLRMVEIDAPVWRLPRPCPGCGQGRCLAFVACPRCLRLAVRCEEEGTVFLDPRDLVGSRKGEPATVVCPGCGEATADLFGMATDAVIRAAGFTREEYE